MSRYVAVGLIALGMVGCDILTSHAYDAPPGTRHIDPPEAFALWHAEAAECADVEHDFGAILWYVVPGGSWVEQRAKGGPVAVRGTSWGHGRIFIAGAWLADEGVVKHEMLHAMGFRGRGIELEPIFVGCSGIGHH